MEDLDVSNPGGPLKPARPPQVALYVPAIERVGPGGVFGEMALVDQSPRAANALADTDCSLLAVSRPVFLNLVSSEPMFGVSLLSSMAQRVRHTAAAVN